MCDKGVRVGLEGLCGGCHVKSWLVTRWFGYKRVGMIAGLCSVQAVGNKKIPYAGSVRGFCDKSAVQPKKYGAESSCYSVVSIVTAVLEATIVSK